MKNLRLTLLLLLFCSSVFAFQNPNSETVEKTNEQIQNLLRDAEASVNKMDFDTALQQLNTSLELSKTIGHKRYTALTSSILAKLYAIRHDYERAKSELERAIAIQREINDQTGLAYSYINYAKIFYSTGDLNRAKKYLDLAETIYEKEGDNNYLGFVELNRGITSLNLEKNYSKALKELNQAKEDLETSNNTYEVSRLYYYRGKTYRLMGMLDKALEDAETALNIGKENHFHGVIQSSYILLSQIYEDKKETGIALDFLKKSNIVRDSIFSMNKDALAVEANTKFGMDALRSTLDELTTRNAEQERSLKVNKLTTILSVALITILSLLTLSLYKNNNLRARANDLLQKKNNELTLAKENAEKASLAKAQFLSTITHELRTPLYAVTGLTHLLLEESPTENQKEHLNSLKFSGEYLLSLINNILDLNKLEANKVEVMETSFNLRKRISDVLVALKNSADDKHTKIHFDFDPEIPKKLKGDPLIISQILINLIGNSIKFTSEGDIWIKVKKTQQENRHVSLYFEIKDNGEGITREKQKTIFENFTQGSTQINRKFGGTGLGLSIVKNLIGLLDSQIHLESELGKGSKFFFELKFEALDLPKNPEKKKTEPASNDVMENKRILIVEDNKINQMITRKILEKHKVLCDVADNGTIAIDKVKKNEFDLILMDIHMPGISGIEATVEIRKFDEDIPIIALTAVTLDDNLDEFFLNGFNDIIPKPYKTEEFFAKINKYLTLKTTTV